MNISRYFANVLILLFFRKNYDERMNKDAEKEKCIKNKEHKDIS